MKPLPCTVAALAAALMLAAGPARALDLVQAWQAAQRHAPEAAVAEAQRQAGQAQGRQAEALWKPTVALEAGLAYARNETAVRGAQFAAPGFGSATGVAFDTSVTGGPSARYALALRQPIYSRERSARGEALGVAARAAELQWTQARQSLMLHTAQAYFEAALAGEKLRLLQQQQQAVARAATEAQDRFRLGDKPVTEVHEAAARLATLKADVLAAQTQLAIAQQALEDLTGLGSPADGLALPQGGPRTDDLGTLPEWLARAERQSPVRQLAEAQLQVAQAQAHASSAAYAPTVDLVAMMGRDRLSGDGDFGRASNTAAQAAVGLQLQVPLYTGGLQSAQHAEHRARVEQARAELAQARLQVAQQARSAWLDLSVGRSRLEALAAAQAASDLRLDATRVGQQAGDRTTLDLLNAENDAMASRLALVSARVRQLTDRLRLAAIAGELDDAALQQANAQLPAPTAR